MSYKVKGVIKKITDRSGTTNEGKQYKKVEFVVSNNDGWEGKEQIFAFDIFGDEKVESFNTYNREGKEVEVSFNIRTNEYKEKYYTSLSAWRVDSVNSDATPQQQTSSVPNTEEEAEDLPFKQKKGCKRPFIYLITLC